MTGTKTSSRKRAGFTLLELLAVVAIISILVMISVPVYHNVQEDAEKKVLEYNTRVLAGEWYRKPVGGAWDHGHSGRRSG